MTKKLLMLGLVLIALFGCRSNSPKPQTGLQPEVTAAAANSSPPIANQTAPTAPTRFKKIFTGTIGDNLAVWMDIERKGAELSGSYYYDRPGAFNVAERTLELKGRIDGQGNVMLDETDYDNENNKANQTGNFKGRLDAVIEAGKQTLRLIGTWTGGKDRKTLAVNLKEQRFNLGGLALADKPTKEERKGYTLETNLPQLTASAPDLAAKADKFNQTLATFTNRRTADFKKSAAEMQRDMADPKQAKAAGDASPAEMPYAMDIGYTVTAASPEFISLLLTCYENTGGAHPNTTTQSFNYDLKRDQALKLSDLFAPGASYLKFISDYSIKELKKLKTTDGVEEGAGPKLENFNSWNITRKGLSLTFDRYQVGPYAVGDHVVTIPYAALKPIMKPDGVLAPLTK